MIAFSYRLLVSLPSIYGGEVFNCPLMGSFDHQMDKILIAMDLPTWMRQGFELSPLDGMIPTLFGAHNWPQLVTAATQCNPTHAATKLRALLPVTLSLKQPFKRMFKQVWDWRQAGM